MSQPFYYRKNSKGEPIVGSNLKATTKPSSAHVQILNVVIGPTPDSKKPRFNNTSRFFIQIDADGNPIKGTLIKSSVTPEGNYLELFKNNVLTLPLESNPDSGAIETTLDDLSNFEPLISYDFLINGSRGSKRV